MTQDFSELDLPTKYVEQKILGMTYDGFQRIPGQISNEYTFYCFVGHVGESDKGIADIFQDFVKGSPIKRSSSLNGIIFGDGTICMYEEDSLDIHIEHDDVAMVVNKDEPVPVFWISSVTGQLNISARLSSDTKRILEVTEYLIKVFPDIPNSTVKLFSDDVPDHNVKDIALLKVYISEGRPLAEEFGVRS